MIRACRTRHSAPASRMYWHYNATILEGQLVKLDDSGYVAACADADLTHGAGKKTTCIGVSGQYSKSDATTGLLQVIVYDDPDQVFRIPLKAATTATQTAIGQSAPPIDNATALATYLSAVKLDTIATADDGLKIIGLANSADTAFDFAPGVFTASVTATEAYVIIASGYHYRRTDTDLA